MLENGPDRIEHFLETAFPNELLDDSEVEIIVDGLNEISDDLIQLIQNEHGIRHVPPHPYHGIEHTNQVVENTLRLFKKYVNHSPWELLDIKFKQYEVLTNTENGLKKISNALKILEAYIRLISSGHDIVQESVVGSDGKLRRKRGFQPGGNEYESAFIIAERINKKFTPGSSVRKILSALNIAAPRIIGDVCATYPEIDPTAKVVNTELIGVKITHGKISDATVQGKLLAVCDILAPYSNIVDDTHQQRALEFLKTPNLTSSTFWSNAEFWEINQDVLECAREAYINPQHTDKAKLQLIFEAVQKWWSSQQAFAMHLRNMFETYIDPQKMYFSENGAEIVKSYFGGKGDMLPDYFASYYKELVKKIEEINSDENIINPQKIIELLTYLNFDSLCLHQQHDSMIL